MRICVCVCVCVRVCILVCLCGQVDERCVEGGVVVVVVSRSIDWSKYKE